jgi:uracil-DNA glycosylase family 4
MVSDSADFLRWLLRRMSITSGFYIDYVLKCYPKNCRQFGTKAHRANMIEACATYRLATLQQMKPRALVAMGTTACEAFTGSEKVSEWAGARWIPNEPFVREFLEGIWVTYSPGYALQGASESVPIYRTLFQAAEEAGLNPKFNPNVKHYDYGT